MSFVSTSLAYITIPKNKRKTKITWDKKLTTTYMLWFNFVLIMAAKEKKSYIKPHCNERCPKLAWVKFIKENGYKPKTWFKTTHRLKEHGMIHELESRKSLNKRS